MRHNKKFNHLGRKSAHRNSMLANMATSLILHKRINTTVPKAKALRIYVEPIITKAKEDSTHSRRVAFSYLRDKNAVTELFRVVAPAVGERPGGYTRILKTGFRLGDAADTCFIELVDFNENYSKEAAAAAKPKTRRSRSASKANVQDAEIVEESGSEANASETAKHKATPKKAAAKSQTTKPSVNKQGAVKTSGAKKTASRNIATKKG